MDGPTCVADVKELEKQIHGVEIDDPPKKVKLHNFKLRLGIGCTGLGLMESHPLPYSASAGKLLYSKHAPC